MFKQEYLCHYGVQGMKWGKRKDKKKISSKKRKSKPKYANSEDYERIKTIKQKNLNQMSNDELKTVTERMRLVNEFQAQARQSIRNGKHWAKATVDKTANVYVSTLTAPNKVIGVAKSIASGTIDGIKYNQQMRALQMP